MVGWMVAKLCSLLFVCLPALSSLQIYRKVVSMEAYLWKKGKSMFHILGKRYYLLSGNCMYYYSHKSDVRPRGNLPPFHTLSHHLSI